MERNNDRIWNGYEFVTDEITPDPIKDVHVSYCEKCELYDLCEKTADELNNIDYLLCQDVIKDKTFKIEHPYAYFRKIV